MSAVVYLVVVFFGLVFGVMSFSGLKPRQR